MNGRIRWARSPQSRSPLATARNRSNSTPGLPDNARFLGIYKIEDGKLTYCREKAARGIRPTEFKATPQSRSPGSQAPSQLELIQGEWVVVDPNAPQQIAKKITVKGNEWTNPMGQKSAIAIDD